jgi:hypothetical protein
MVCGGLPGGCPADNSGGGPRRAAAGSRVRHRDGESRVRSDRRQSQRAVYHPYTHAANTAGNYFAVAHPSLTNYLEIVGGSNFGVLSDHAPDWHNAQCKPDIVEPFTQNRDDDPHPKAVCPIGGTGMDAETVAIDTTNETTPPYISALVNIDGQSIPSAPTTGKSIADQLAERGRTWKSYQESLPPGGANGVNNSDGFFTDSVADTNKVKALLPKEDQTVPALYAVKYNPFVYFRSVQEHGFGNVAGFDGPRGLFDDLASGRVPDFAFVVPNQCHDQHGRGNAGAACDFDPGPLGDGTFTDGSMNFLNPALIYQGDLAVRTLVHAIHNSSVWKESRTAIVVVWDENDYSAVNNRVLAIIDTNFGDHDVHGSRFYTPRC